MRRQDARVSGTATPAIGRPMPGRPAEYTPKDSVETMSYMPADAPTPQLPQTLQPVRVLEVAPDQAGQRLDNFVHRLLSNLPRSRIYRLIRRGEVRVNGRRAGPDSRLQALDKVRIPPVRLKAPEELAQPGAQLLQSIQRAIVFEDERLLVLNKPAGIAVHGGSGVSFGVIEALRALRPGDPLELVHRLDRDTSGCLIVARQTAALRTLHALLREGGLEKRYLSLLKGQWELGRKRIDLPLRTDLRVGGERTVRVDPQGKKSVSEFRPVQFFGKRATVVEVALETGRTHQIRVHAQHAGHPVAGDEKYGDAAFNEELERLGLRRMFLHAHSVSFQWPGGSQFSVNTPLSPELAQVLDSLGAATTARTRRNAPSR